MRSALVTGGRGLLGAWLCKALVARGVRVVVLTQGGGVSALELDGTDRACELERGDVRDGALLQRLLDRHEVDTVFHLAARSIVGDSRLAPEETADVNVGGTRAVLAACASHGVERLVAAGTSLAYGPGGPFSEDAPLRPRTPYAASKAGAEGLVLESGLPAAATRATNVYGGGDRQHSRLVPALVAAALRGESPELRSDGSARLDFLYVEDAVAAYLAIAEAIGAGAAGQAFNVGSGEPVAVRDVVALVCGPENAPAPRADGSVSSVDTGRLRALGWAPRVGLEEGLRRTIDWHRRQGATGNESSAR